MTLFAATLLGFALTDLVRGGTPAGRNRSLVAIAIATAAGVGLLLLAGLPCSTLYWFGPALAAVLAGSALAIAGTSAAIAMVASAARFPS